VLRYRELDQGFFNLKTKYAKQQSKLESCMLKLHEMTQNHKQDISLIAKSEDLMRKMQLQQTDAEK
jgi:hypothetical protein